jgi:hypothetical protein
MMVLAVESWTLMFVNVSLQCVLYVFIYILSTRLLPRLAL